MDDIFETCLEHVMDMNCVMEGTFMAKKLDKIGKMSDDDLRKTMTYKSVYSALVSTNGKNLKPFKEKLKKAKDIIFDSEKKYLSKSTPRQILETLAIAQTVDQLRDIAVAFSGSGEMASPKGYIGPVHIATYKKIFRSQELAVKDFEKEKEINSLSIDFDS